MLVAYVGPFLVGKDSAGLQRVLGNAAALASAGHEVVVAGQGQAGTAREPLPGVSVVGFGDVSGLSRTARVRGGHGVKQWLDQVDLVPNVVVAYGGAGPFTRVVERWSRLQGVRRIIDSVEWYEGAHLPGGVLGPRALDNEYSMRVRYPRYDGAIAISSFLQRHYQSKGTPSMCVPPLLDVPEMKAGRKLESGPVTVVYAGTPGKKDSLGKLVSAMHRADPRGENLRIEVLGVDEEVGRRLPGMPSGRVRGVEFLGRVPREQALTRVARADYVPMIRPDSRFAHAGFPTKVAEAMAAGVAVLGNHTSDLADHVKDMETGLVVADDSLESVAEGLTRAMDGGKSLAAELGAHSRAHAEATFHFEKWSTPMSDWIEQVCRG